MMPFNNPLMQMVNMARSGGNPMTMLQQMAGRDPRIGQFMNMVGGKSPRQLQQIAENMAKERGINLEELARQLGMQAPGK